MDFLQFQREAYVWDQPSIAGRDPVRAPRGRGGAPGRLPRRAPQLQRGASARPGRERQPRAGRPLPSEISVAAAIEEPESVEHRRDALLQVCGIRPFARFRFSKDDIFGCAPLSLSVLL